MRSPSVFQLRLRCDMPRHIFASRRQAFEFSKRELEKLQEEEDRVQQDLDARMQEDSASPFVPVKAEELSPKEEDET